METPIQTLPLWPGGAPGALGAEEQDVPAVTVYPPPPETAGGAAIVVCPGGGYGHLAAHEGEPVARWLNGLGILGVVLRYRLGPRYRHPAMSDDAARAIRLVRSSAVEWRLDPGRIGILGFSAGGHLASTAATRFDDGKPGADDPIERHSSRPDVAILLYPVITLGGHYAHAGSRTNLLGEDPAEDLVRALSSETQVSARTPPTFLVHTNEDRGVPAENSLLFALALRRAGVPVELHLYERGPHGFGMGKGDRVPPGGPVSGWPAQCAAWLEGRGFLTPGG